MNLMMKFFRKFKRAALLRQNFSLLRFVLDILYEKYDENLWRLVLGYVPLNIVFEKIDDRCKWCEENLSNTN